MKIIKDKTFEEERDLYNLKDAVVTNCIFKGEVDGESHLKEARNIQVDACEFHLRYPLWHVNKCDLRNSKFFETSRAPLWYSENLSINNTHINSVKAIRECKDVLICDSNIISEEFGWKSTNIEIINSNIKGFYSFLESKNVKLDNITFKGKYSFQYMENLEINNSYLEAKDAFWHSEDIIIRDSTIKGEYLAWYSKRLTLDNCKIIGTKPFCYSEDLKLIDCELIDCDLAFEYSSVDASIKGTILSIKNPKSGKIIVDEVKEIITTNPVYECHCDIIIRNK